MSTYGGELFTPCEKCRPKIHPYNLPVYKLYDTCKDQVICGPNGVIGINELAIARVMKDYFKVRKSEKLELSMRTKELFYKVLKARNDK